MIVRKNDLHNAFKIIDKGSKKGASYLIGEDSSLYLVYSNRNDDNKLGTYYIIAKIGETPLENFSHKIKTSVKQIQRGLRGFKSDNLNLEIKDNTFIVNSENKYLNIELIENLDMSIPRLPRTSAWNYNTTELKKRLESVYPMSSKDSYRPHLTGVTFYEHDIVALDGYRLGVSTDLNKRNKLPKINIYGEESKMLINILKTLEKDSSMVEIATTELGYTIFEVGNVQLIADTSDSDNFNFDYKKVLEEQQEVGAIAVFEDINIKSLLDEINFIQINSKYVRLHEGELKGYEEITDEKHICSVKVNEKQDSDIDITVNVKFLKEILNSMRKSKDKVTIELFGGLNPALLKSDDLSYILLPVGR